MPRLGRSRTLLMAMMVLVLGVVLLLFNLYQLKLMQQDHTMHGVIVEASSADDSHQPILHVYGRNVDGGYLRHVLVVFERLGYQRGGLDSQWDVMWAHDYPFTKLATQLAHLKPHQKINHFPGSGFVTNKASLVMTNFTHIPKSFLMPKAASAFKAYADTHPDTLWVQKSNSHRGIRIKTVEELNLGGESTFVQEYVSKPFLIDGRRFDIGVYATVTSINPLRIYASEAEWLIRFCPHEYHPFNPADEKKYIISDDYMPPWKIPSLAKYYNDLDMTRRDSLLTYMKDQGYDSEKMVHGIYETMREVYLKKQGALIQAASKFQTTRHFFEMVRFDFLVGEDFSVYLMEVNMSPNLSTGHFSGNRLMYEQVLFNMLSLVGVARSTKNDMVRGSADELEMQVSNKNIRVYFELCSSQLCQDNCRSEECKLCVDCLKADQQHSLRDAYMEHTNRHVWRRVFPTPFGTQEAAQKWDYKTDKEFSDLRPADKTITMWFRGKCLNDAEWCT